MTFPAKPNAKKRNGNQWCPQTKTEPAAFRFGFGHFRLPTSCTQSIFRSSSFRIRGSHHERAQWWPAPAPPNRGSDGCDERESERTRLGDRDHCKRMYIAIDVPTPDDHA